MLDIKPDTDLMSTIIIVMDILCVACSTVALIIVTVRKIINKK